MRKKMIALLMALSMAPVPAAYGSGSNTGNNTNEPTTEAQVGETTAAQETEAQGQEETRVETKVEVPAPSGTMKVVATSKNYVTLFDKFAEDIGVKTELLSVSSGEVFSKLRVEGGTLSADLWFGGGIDVFMNAREDGLLEQVSFDASVDLAEESEDSESYWYSEGVTTAGFLINNGLMEELNIEAPANWGDLLKAEYEGEIIMSNLTVSGANCVVANVLPQAKGEDESWSYFEGLSKNIAYYAKRGSDPKNKVTVDEYAIDVTYIDGTIESLLDGYDVSITYPEDGIPWVPEGVATLKNAEDGGTVRCLIEWLSSSDDNLRMLAEIGQENSIETVKPLLEGLDLGCDTGVLMKEDLFLFGEKCAEILEHSEALMGDKAADEQV